MRKYLTVRTRVLWCNYSRSDEIFACVGIKYTHAYQGLCRTAHTFVKVNIRDGAIVLEVTWPGRQAGALRMSTDGWSPPRRGKTQTKWGARFPFAFFPSPLSTPTPLPLAFLRPFINFCLWQLLPNSAFKGSSYLPAACRLCFER